MQEDEAPKTEFQDLVSRLATSVVTAHADRVDASVNQALRVLAEFASAAHAATMVFDTAQGRLFLANEWCADGEAPLPRSAEGASFVDCEFFIARMRRQEDLAVNDTSDHPECTRQKCGWLDEHAFCAMLAVPVVLDNQTTGALILLDKRGHRHLWRESDRAAARVAAALIGHVLARARADADLRAGEERQRLLIEQAPVSIATYTPDGRLVSANPAWLRLWGLKEANYQYNALEDPQLREHGGDIPFRRALEGEASVIPGMHFDPPQSGQPGRRRWTDTYISPVRDSSGRVCNVLVVQVDVTAQRELAAHLDLFRRFADGSAQGCIWSDLDGRVVYANGAAARLLGRASSDQLMGRPLLDFYQSDELKRIEEQVMPQVRSGQPWTGELAMLRADGQGVPILANLFLLADDRGIPLHLANFLTDLSERQRAEEERARMENRLQQAQKLESLALLAGGIAHDFNNILCGILGSADLVRDQLGPEHEASRDLEVLLQAAHRASDLCRHMLAYAGKGRLSVEPVNLNQVVEGMLDLLHASLSKGARLECRLGTDPRTVVVDVTQIRQVLLNLVVNASEAMPDGGGHITLTTGVMTCDRECLDSYQAGSGLQEGVYAFLQVSDDGLGMSPEIRARIFEPFFSTKFSGRGLGLAATLGIVRGHQGAIRVDSQPGQGSTFRVLLPVSAQSPRKRPPPTPQPLWSGGGVVLVIDDEPMVRQVASGMLGRLGFKTVLAEDGPSGLKVYAEHAQDIALVLLDMTMPGPDGEEVYRALRRINPELKVLLTSGYNEPDTIERLAGEGLSGFVAKPFDLDVLRKKMREALEPHRR